MQVITGEALTGEAPRIIKRLCNHWGHKLAVRLEGDTGVIDFPDAQVTLRALPDRVSATIASEDPAALRRLPGVVATHLARMAGSDPPLEMHWPT
jgi:hypothetical protein